MPNKITMEEFLANSQKQLDDIQLELDYRTRSTDPNVTTAISLIRKAIGELDAALVTAAKDRENANKPYRPILLGRSC